MKLFLALISVSAAFLLPWSLVTKEDVFEGIEAKVTSTQVGQKDFKGSEEKDKDLPTLLQLLSNHPELTVAAKMVSERDVIVAALQDPNADITLFVPSDEAFGKLKHPPPPESVTQVLIYHAVRPTLFSGDLFNGQLLTSALESDGLDGSPQKIKVAFEQEDGSTVLTLNAHSEIEQTDLQASNGVIHIINRILLPPPNLFWMVSHVPFEFGVLQLALRRAGLDEPLKNTPSLTLFGPTNAAFKDLGLKKLAYLFSKKGEKALIKILLFHTLPQVQYESDLVDHEGEFTLPTLLHHHDLHFKVSVPEDSQNPKDSVQKTLTVNDAFVEIENGVEIERQDVLGFNGVLHGINAVLMPDRDFLLDIHDDVDFEELSSQLLSFF